MLRFVIGLGVLLMVLGFGAAGWQYWQGIAGADRPGATLPPVTEVWLGTATGTIVPAEVTAAFLQQDRLVPRRIATITHVAPLTDLLRDAEPLPAPAFLEVMADIRAPLLAEGFCPVLQDMIAEDCQIHSARVVAGSVDAQSGTAQFRIELAYRLKPDVADLPDLAEQVFGSLDVEIGVAPEVVPGNTAATALAAVVEAGLLACSADSAGYPCRIIGLTLDWAPAVPFQGVATVGWLSPLPDGVLAIPEIRTLPEG